MFNAPPPLKRLGAAWVAGGSLCAGAALASHHPLCPMLALSALALWCLLLVWRPGLWLGVVPACLPFLNFSPWTGWLVVDEFDLLLLGTLATGYGHGAWTRHPGPKSPWPCAMVIWTALLGAWSVMGLYRGFSDAGGLSGGFAIDWFAAYTDAWNSLRIFKSLGFALLFWPLLQHELQRSPALAHQRLGLGMVAGLGVTVLAVLWERAAFPGLLNFSSHYRTVALFWEMHVGGAALDGYLALASPFAVWALVSARSPVAWTGAALLAWLTGYAVLTTFSRGVVFATLGALLVLAWLDPHRSAGHHYAPQVWRAPARLVLGLGLIAEVVVILGAGPFMADRLSRTQDDFSSRLAHWKSGLDLLHSPTDWLLGIGLGRFPSHYAAQTPRAEFPGTAGAGHEQPPGAPINGFATLRGPLTRKSLGGQFSLTQRVRPRAAGAHQVSLNVRVTQTVDLQFELCERHLLYDAACQSGLIRVQPGTAAWQSVATSLEGDALTGGPWYAPRLNLFALSAVTPGAVVDIDNIHLRGQGPDAPEMLANGDFSHSLAHWFPAAQSYYLPWHVDNLFLEWLVERGWMGLLLLTTLLGSGLWQLACSRARTLPLSPYLCAALIAAMGVGLVGSLMDAPRVAFLLLFLVGYAKQSAPPTTSTAFMRKINPWKALQRRLPFHLNRGV